MNIFLWILQVVLAFLCLSGGGYKVFKFELLARQIGTLEPGGWRALGFFELACGFLLIVPGAMGWTPILIAIPAGLLALECLVLTFVYARESLDLAAANPLVWSVVMGLMAGFVACARYAFRPPA